MLKNSKIVIDNALSSILQVVISSILLFIIYKYLFVKLGVEKLGIWSLLIASTSAARVSELGLAGSVTRFVAKYKARKQLETAAVTIETGFVSVAIMMGILLFASMPLIRWVLMLVMPANQYEIAYLILPFALFSMWLTSLFGVLVAGLDGCQLILMRNIIILLGYISFFILLIFLVPSYGLNGVIYSQICQNMLVIIISWILLKRKMKYLSIFPSKWKLYRFKEMLLYGFQFQVAGIAMMLYDPITKMFISRFGGLSLVGYFEMASQMVLKLRSILLSGNQVLVPVLATAGEISPENVRKIYVNSFAVILYLSLPFYSMIASFTPVISVLWIGEYQINFIIFSFALCVGWFFNTINGPAFFANLGSGMLLWNTVGHLSIGLLNILLGIVLGNILGGIGAVVGWAIALGSGSMIITIAYNLKNEIKTCELLGTKSYFLIMLCLLNPVVCFYIHNCLSAYFSHYLIIVVICIVSIITISVPVWRHPVRSRLSKWLMSSFS